MINRQQALEIIEKFEFFQGQRAGRELWADKPKKVQEDDLIHFQVDCELLKEFIESQPERPKGQWIGMEGYRMIGFDKFGLEKFRHYRYCKCRICGRKTAVKSNFCPNCGADMRGEKNV